MLRATCLATLGLFALASACTESVPQEEAPLEAGTPSSEDSGDASTPPAGPAPAVPCSDAVEAIYADPGALPAPSAAIRGDIVKCVHEQGITKEALTAKLTEVGYAGKAITSGAYVYRTLYRTERGDTAGSAGTSSATVYLPDAPRAAKLPVVVFSHGSRGQAAACAPSKHDPAASSVENDLLSNVYPLVGAGFAVIVPDLAGYANYGAAGNPPSGYANANDVGRSTLDGARAVRKLFPDMLDTKVALVGHSQGGHTSLASLAISGTYASDLTIAAVATYAPLWLSQRSWGAVLSPAVTNSYPTSTSIVPAVSVWYNYTTAELLDGPGAGKALFGAKGDAIKQFVDSTCWSGSNYPALAALGGTAQDLFDPTFVSEVSAAAAGLGTCSTDLCTKWIARYTDDRPHLTGAAKDVPQLMVYGGADTTIPPERMKCALDRLTSDGANFSMCYVGTADHNTIVDQKADYVADWIASKTLGTEAPPACAADQTAITASCATPPPND